MGDQNYLHEWTELEPAVGTPSVIIGLIHGTKAPDAKWCQCGSLLHSAIQQNVGGNPLVCSFRWSGKNCIVSRKQAAHAPHEKLIGSQAKYPGIPHILIGHSHGGNIALEAAAGLPMQPQIRIVVSGI